MGLLSRHFTSRFVTAPILQPHVLDALLEHATDLALTNVEAHGAPFSAVIVDANCDILATGVNRVGENCDPTAHAEVMAIRHAATLRATSNLSGTVLIASGEPCAMCCVIALFAGIQQVIFAADREEAARFGFDYRAPYQWLADGGTAMPLIAHKHATTRALEPFQRWQELQQPK